MRRPRHGYRHPLQPILYTQGLVLWSKAEY
jgi:hypothetical protein